MKAAKIVAWIALLAMTAVLIYGFTVGDFAGEGGRLMRMPWGIVSLVDLYAGFALFSVWIAYREQSLPAKIIWVVLMMILGFWTGALYTLVALYQAKGDWERFWRGIHTG